MSFSIENSMNQRFSVIKNQFLPYGAVNYSSKNKTTNKSWSHLQLPITEHNKTEMMICCVNGMGWPGKFKLIQGNSKLIESQSCNDKFL